MGQEIGKAEFTESDFDTFHQKLRNETKLLMKWFNDGVLDQEGGVCGSEVEAWLTDENFLPMPGNVEFLKKTKHSQIVPEIAQFNFEINGEPQTIDSDVLSRTHRDLSECWTISREAAQSLNSNSIMIGSLPTLRDEMLSMEYISPLKRYFALNERVLEMRKSEPLHLKIDGIDHLEVTHSNVMMECAATSLQVHLQVEPSRAKDYYNASQMLAGPMIAMSANSPYLFGKDLWAETRIPLFEQAVNVPSFRGRHSEPIGRVTFGTRFLRESLFELFLENLDGYATLLPLVTDDDSEWLSHLRLHNGTIWRWNRPIVGISNLGKPHLRIEHRVIASGPTMTDIVANIAFYLGAVHYYADHMDALLRNVKFENVRRDFYNCAKNGLGAQISWMGQESSSVHQILLNEILPNAKSALKNIGVSSVDLATYFDNTLRPRLLNGQNGATWQRSFIATHGTDFQALTEQYMINQNSGNSVHDWKV